VSCVMYVDLLSEGGGGGACTLELDGGQGALGATHGEGQRRLGCSEVVGSVTLSAMGQGRGGGGGATLLPLLSLTSLVEGGAGLVGFGGGGGVGVGVAVG
jgi:hypothetical protein